MNEIVPTTYVKDQNGDVTRINTSDVDLSKHTIISNDEAEKILAANAPVDEQKTVVDPNAPVVGGGASLNPPAPVVSYKVGRNGKQGDEAKFVVLDANDEKVGINEYDTEEEAFKVVQQMSGETAQQ